MSCRALCAYLGPALYIAEGSWRNVHAANHLSKRCYVGRQTPL